LAGCVHAAVSYRPAEPRRGKEEPERSEPSCDIRLTKNDFSVKKTGQKQSINGFDAEEYHATWIVEGEDSKKMKDTSTLEITLWTTPESDQIRKIEEVQKEYHRVYLQKIGIGKTQTVGKIPAEAMGILSARLFGTMGEKGHNALLHAAKEMEKVKGFPISTKLEWYLDGKACGKEGSHAERERNQEGSNAEGIGGLLSGLMGKSSEKKGDEKAEGSKRGPVFGFVQEIKTMNIGPASDGLFQPPASYKLIKQQ
jgi:hypothetical protein